MDQETIQPKNATTSLEELEQEIDRMEAQMDSRDEDQSPTQELPWWKKIFRIG